ncbi:ATP-dependent RNA helicase DDX50 [Cyclospora cayetanensis]|uniref:RNA helicase n=2 Tax=Cyclospora cayetanensis TaxID=88456 RepID=A0A1D3CSS0_9EIME|nr:ATP-dependent RNA helicase DDX50 [Cyclospora cayetanensis]OEH74236.1 hypothetical protein cyc_01901 [Cyclospora cayetanensis]
MVATERTRKRREPSANAVMDAPADMEEALRTTAKGNKEDEKRKSTATKCIKADGNQDPEEGGNEEFARGQFDRFPICKVTLDQLKTLGFQRLLPVQFLSFHLVHQGKDVVCKARTGTGKTLAFALPLIERFFSNLAKDSFKPKPPLRGLVKKQPGTPELKVVAVLPTRELAQQVHADFQRLAVGRFSSICIFGGAPEGPQITSIRSGCNVLVATPGRLLDFLGRGILTLEGTEAVVLDEADKLLEMGFREDIEQLLKLLGEQKKGKDGDSKRGTAVDESEDDRKKGSHQLLLFTATFPKWAKGIAEAFMRHDRAFVDGTAYQQQQEGKESGVTKHMPGGSGSGSGLIRHLALQCHWKGRVDALPLLLSLYCQDEASSAGAGEGAGNAPAGPQGVAAPVSSLCAIFCETKQEVNEVALNSCISGSACALHGDIPQQQREATLKSFRQGKFKCLVATDVAARGLDIAGIRLVVQMSPPKDIDTYVHRAGRTGRAGRRGTALLFYGKGDTDFLAQIEIEGAFQFMRVGFPQGEALKRQRFLATAQSLFPSLKVGSLSGEGERMGEEELLQKLSKKVLKKTAPEDAIAQLLGRLLQDEAAAGAATTPQVSPLTGRQEFVSFHLVFDPAPSPPLQGSCAYVWRALKNRFTEEKATSLIEKIEYMTLTADGCGAVFDLPAAEEELWEALVLRPLPTMLDSRGRKAGFTIKSMIELPPLQDGLYLARQSAAQQSQGGARATQAARYNPNHVSSRRGGRGGAPGGNRFDRPGTHGGRPSTHARGGLRAPGHRGTNMSRGGGRLGGHGPAKRQRVV